MMFPSCTSNYKSVSNELPTLQRCIFSGKKFVSANVRSWWWSRLACETLYSSHAYNYSLTLLTVTFVVLVVTCFPRQSTNKTDTQHGDHPTQQTLSLHFATELTRRSQLRRTKAMQSYRRMPNCLLLLLLLAGDISTNPGALSGAANVC